jgi:hypothetical protein
MKTLVLPYLTSSTTSTSRTGKIKFGWREEQVSIQEADPSDFRIAYSKTIIENISFSIYEYCGQFWSNTIKPFHPMAFNSGGVRWEAPYEESERGWLELACSEAFIRRLSKRALAEGVVFRKTNYVDQKTRTTLASGDGPESDRAEFLEWASDNFLWADGHLMRRIHSPSVAVGWAGSHISLTSACIPLKSMCSMLGFGKHTFDPGIHFRLGDLQVESALAEANAKFSSGYPTNELAQTLRNSQALRETLARSGMTDRFVVQGSSIFDPSVLSRIPDEDWEDMAERSAVSIAESIVATSAPHFHRDGPKRQSLEQLKRLVDIVPQDRTDHFLDQLESALSSLPTEGEPARAWFVDMALSQLADRSISLSPTPSTIGMKMS